MKKIFLAFYIIIFSAVNSGFFLYALDFTDVHSGLADFFSSLQGKNEGTTSFRSLLIPLGGRSESLGGAYTGLSDDVSYIDYNPAAASIQEETEVAFIHNSWIADSNLETIAATTRFGSFGLGGKISCFYVPFSEYDSFGTKVTSSYYSETTAALNVAYTFFPGYTFKGISVGANLKASWRAVPDYTDSDTGSLIQNSGLEQSALGLMADFGIMTQMNLAKMYNAHEANFKIGISALNFGTALTGFSSSVKKDDPLPASVGLGVSYKIIRPFTIALEFRQPLNLQDFSEYQMFYAGLGSEIRFTDFFALLAGFQIKGANPRFSLGGEVDISSFTLNANYTLDLTTSLNPVNRISVSAKIKMGDKGRKEKQQKVFEIYNEGIYWFAQKDYKKATEKWQEALRIDKYFDPARTGIKITQKYVQMLDEMEGISNSYSIE